MYTELNKKLTCSFKPQDIGAEGDCPYLKGLIMSREYSVVFLIELQRAAPKDAENLHGATVHTLNQLHSCICGYIANKFLLVRGLAKISFHKRWYPQSYLEQN